MSEGFKKYFKYGLIILLSVGLILFTQSIKLLKDPNSTPITMMTVYGLATLWLFSMIGIVISNLMQRSSVKFVRDFPILGWVSITSLVFCLLSDTFVEAIQAVDFLSITTPILTYAGVSVADRLVDLRKTSWKIAIVAVFVFLGTYLGSAMLAEMGFFLSNR